MNADGSARRALTDVRVIGTLPTLDERRKRLDFRCRGRPRRTMSVALRRAARPSRPRRDRRRAHVLSPDYSRIMDVVGHRELWRLALMDGGRKVFEFDDADARIDYPVWSPDGKSLLFDRFRPQGGDIWVMEGVQ